MKITLTIISLFILNIAFCQVDSIIITDELNEQISNDTNEVYNFADVTQNAKYKGGLSAMADFLRINLNYPKDALDNDWEGRVYVSFVIEKNGLVNLVEIARGTNHSSLDKEALRLVSSFPKWIPADFEGNPVRQRFVLPIKFSIAD